MVSGHSESNKNKNQPYKKLDREEWNQQPKPTQEKVEKSKNQPSSFENSVNDLFELFGQENFEEETFSSNLPSDEEISQVFFDDDLWDESLATDISLIKKAEPKTEINPKITNELIDLFEDEPETAPILEQNQLRETPPEPPEPPTITEEAEKEPAEVAASLLESEEFEISEDIIILETEGSIVFDTLHPVREVKEVTAQHKTLVPCLSLYNSLEEIEKIININVQKSPKVDYQALEALINKEVQKEQSQELALSEEHIFDHSDLFDFAKTFEKETEIEDPFQDLEELLKQTERTMKPRAAASQTIVAGGQALRNRATKVKIFEQTMRVPIKQLDNLSNLIGELVIKRNGLEQDQERMQQFVNNLLNQVQTLGDLGTRMQELYEKTLLTGALLASRKANAASHSYLDQPISSQVSTLTKSPISSDTSPTNSNNEFDAIELDRFTDFHILAQEMMEVVVRVRESTSDIQFLVGSSEQVSRSLRQVTTQLQEGMTKSRMVSFGPIAERFSRAVKDISLTLNKQAKLHVDGKEVLVDKMILEHLYDPMTHLVNNAMAHGIETAAERRKAGKTPEGTITIRAFLQGNQTVIVVADDGAGINPELIKAKAIEKGLLSEVEATTIKKQELYDLLFHPGFSTKDKADQYSGRGVGLDVVRTALSEIRGSVSIDSEIDQGTNFTIRLPLTLSICKALCCLSDNARIAFPMDGVEYTKDYSTKEIVINQTGQKCVMWNKTLIPFQPLSALLSFNRSNKRNNLYGGKKLEDDIFSLVVLRTAGNLLAVQVDRVLGEEEIVIKQIEGPIPKPIGIAGATVLGNGSIMPIGDVLELVEISQGRSRVENLNSLWKKTIPNESPTLHNKEKVDPLVLIVDDSITVRELLSGSFSKAGYRVEQARDGQEAWDKLRSGLYCDIIFCDIEMPRMNGLDLLANIQKDEKLSNIPVALLTSRAAEKHRSIAAKYGASGYFIKPYTEKDILDAADRIINGDVLLPGSSRLPRTPKPTTLTQIEQSIKTDVYSSKTGPRILVVDDSAMIRAMISTTLSKGGYQSIEARDGQDALEKLRSGMEFDLILCDIEMPRMNGLELLARLQEDNQLSTIPIAMITSRGAQKMKTLAAERGAKAYFVKPYIDEEILDATKRLISGEVLLDLTNLT